VTNGESEFFRVLRISRDVQPLFFFLFELMLFLQGPKALMFSEQDIYQQNRFLLRGKTKDFFFTIE
jgi:hypothetical protein